MLNFLVSSPNCMIETLTLNDNEIDSRLLSNFIKVAKGESVSRWIAKGVCVSCWIGTLLEQE